MRWRTWVEIYREDLMADWELVTTDMKENDFNKLMASIKEAGQIKTGKVAPARIEEIQPPEIQKIRRKLHISQEDSLPNAETAAAMRELEEGKGKSFTGVDELLADLTAKRV